MSKTWHYIKQILFYLFLAAYILLFAKALLFKQVSPFGLFSPDRVIERALNLIPFKTILEYTSFNLPIAIMNIAGNIVLFIPLGLYLQIFRKNKKVLPCVAIACAVSLCIEIIQYGFGLGSADIDDIILNTLGGLLGIIIYRIIYSQLKDEEKTKTAVTVLFCLVCMGLGVCYFVLTRVFGYLIRIF